MKKLIIRVVTFATVFFISLFVASAVLNRGSSDLTTTMSSATLPIVYMNVNDEYINPLHGYTVAMEGNYLRGSITPLMANREVMFRADLFDAIIAGVAFEVRTMDMSRLIEDTQVTDFYLEDNRLYGTIPIKDLIEDDTEYMLIIKLTTSSGDIIRYYARVINKAELSISEKVTFVRDFSARTFNKGAAEELKNYMESNKDGDNSSFAHVNIHSSFKQLTWGDLSPAIKTIKNLEILEIDSSTASILLTYQVEILGEDHNVTEFFRVMKGKDRMYLMEYERSVSQIFDMEKNVIVNGKILHGILDEEPQIVESPSGATLCFVQQNQLYGYSPMSGVLTEVFAFCDKDNNDERTRYDAHGIKALSVDESGNIYFAVYGYMNRGIHEGEVGVDFYYFDSALNTVEEQFFIPYTKSFQLLKNDIDSLAYINAKKNFYLLLDGTIYCINGLDQTIDIIAEKITENKFVASTDRSVIAWQTGESTQDSSEIKLLNLNWNSPSSILADSESIIIPLGFMDYDLIYGVARTSDFTKDDTGRTVTPMYAVRIQDINGNILKEYNQSGMYVTEAEVSDNMIVMERLQRNGETGAYEEAPQDQIMNNEVSSTKLNILTSVVTDETETTYQTVLRRQPSTKSSKLVNPKQVVFEGDRNIKLDNPDTLTRYYVYAQNEVIGVYTDASEAVIKAYDNYGVVVDKKCAYIWETENRKTSTQISKIGVPDTQINQIGENAEEFAENTSENYDEGYYYDENGELVAVGGSEGEEFAGEAVYAQGERTKRLYGLCLDAMLQGADVYKDTAKLLADESLTQVLQESLPDAQVLDLTGCDLSAVLYYVSREFPVMVLCPGSEAVVIVGYDSKNTILYNPMEGTITKMGLNDSRAWFERNGNKYITYVGAVND